MYYFMPCRSYWTVTNIPRFSRQGIHCYVLIMWRYCQRSPTVNLNLFHGLDNDGDACDNLERFISVCITLQFAETSQVYIVVVYLSSCCSVLMKLRKCCYLEIWVRHLSFLFLLALTKLKLFNWRLVCNRQQLQLSQQCFFWLCVVVAVSILFVAFISFSVA